jgi:uncharacterized protein (TIGR02300 family)
VAKQARLGSRRDILAVGRRRSAAASYHGALRDAIDSGLASGQGKHHFSSSYGLFKDFQTVAKPELGTKRLCGSCGAKFYDLSKDPIVCPKCGTVFEIVVPVARGRAAEAAAAAAAGAAAAAAAARAPAKEAEAEVPETADVELVSLEDADAEASGKKTDAEAAEGDDDIEIEETEEAPFIEEQEEGDDDVTDIIGDGTKDDEES